MFVELQLLLFCIWLIKMFWERYRTWGTQILFSFLYIYSIIIISLKLSFEKFVTQFERDDYIISYIFGYVPWHRYWPSSIHVKINRWGRLIAVHFGFRRLLSFRWHNFSLCDPKKDVSRPSSSNLWEHIFGLTWVKHWSHERCWGVPVLNLGR